VVPEEVDSNGAFLLATKDSVRETKLLGTVRALGLSTSFSKLRLMNARTCRVLPFLLSLAMLACQPSAPPAKAPPNHDWDGYEAPSPVVTPPPSDLPEEVPFVAGKAPPNGYKRIESPRWDSVAIGAAAFAIAYMPPALVSTQVGGNAWTLQVPFAGPILLAAGFTDKLIENGGPGYGLFGYLVVGEVYIVLATLAAVQTTGVIVIVMGLVDPESRWVRNDLALIDTPTLRVTPKFLGNGFQLNGTF
jgi:hypothetical protein